MFGPDTFPSPAGEGEGEGYGTPGNDGLHKKPSRAAVGPVMSTLTCGYTWSPPRKPLLEQSLMALELKADLMHSGFKIRAKNSVANAEICSALVRN